MASNKDPGASKQHGRLFEPNSCFFRGESVGRQREQIQNCSGLVPEAVGGEQDLSPMGQARCRSDGFNFQPKSSFFLQLEQSGPRSSSTGCSSTRCGLDKMGEPILLPTLSPHRGCLEEGGGAASQEDDIGGPLVDVQDLPAIPSGK